MKRTFTWCVLMVNILVSYADVELEIRDGMDNCALKSKIESNASKFFTETERAYKNNSSLNLTGLVNKDAEMSIEMLWENVHFRPEDEYIKESLLKNGSGGYQIRNIPLILSPQESNMGEEYKEAVLNFDNSGNISSVYFSIDNNAYKRIQEKGELLNDMSKRLEILDYVEKFRTSYNQRDIDFLNQVFSEDALIITGKVIKPKASGGDMIGLQPGHLEYTKQDKQTYLTRLNQIFKTVKYLNVEFEDVIIKRHSANPNIYGVQVIQHYNSSTYSDEGYVFMLWDFTDPDAPQIHVRTWQPRYIEQNGKKVELPEEEIFDLNSIRGI